MTTPSPSLPALIEEAVDKLIERGLKCASGQWICIDKRNAVDVLLAALQQGAPREGHAQEMAHMDSTGQSDQQATDDALCAALSRKAQAGKIVKENAPSPQVGETA